MKPLASEKLELLAIGESMVVLAPEGNQSLESVATVSLHTGGAESNVVRYLAQQKHRVGWASRLGDDPFGRRVLADLKSWGVQVANTTLVSNETTGVYFKDPTGPTKVYYYRRGSAASKMVLQDISEAVKQTKRIHVSGITPALSATCAEMLEQLMDTSKKHGVLISFDVNFRPALWSPRIASSTLQNFALKADIVFVGRDEAESLWQTVTPEAIRSQLNSVPELIVKDGAVGATAFIGESERIFQSTPASDVVEPVGAGDAFAAGYLSGLIQQLPYAQRLRLGHIFAMAAMSNHADNAELPSEAKIEELMGLNDEEWNLQAAVRKCSAGSS